MDLSYQGARCIDNMQTPLLSLAPDGWRDSMRAEDRARSRRHLVQLLDKDGARIAQLIHHVLVMHDFLTHIHRRAVKIQGDLDDVDSSHHSGAESARLEQKYF